MVEDRIVRLSDIQKQCLRWVGQGRSSKEIGPMLGISHRTVDQYIYLAIDLLGAQNRRDAARIFAECEAAGGLKEFQLKPHAVASLEISVISEGPTETLKQKPSLLSLPLRGGPENDLSMTTRAIEIAKISLFLLIAAIAILILAKGAFDFFSV